VFPKTDRLPRGNCASSCENHAVPLPPLPITRPRSRCAPGLRHHVSFGVHRTFRAVQREMSWRLQRRSSSPPSCWQPIRSRLQCNTTLQTPVPLRIAGVRRLMGARPQLKPGRAGVEAAFRPRPEHPANRVIARPSTTTRPGRDAQEAPLEHSAYWTALPLHVPGEHVNSTPVVSAPASHDRPNTAPLFKHMGLDRQNAPRRHGEWTRRISKGRRQVDTYCPQPPNPP